MRHAKDRPRKGQAAHSTDPAKRVRPENRQKHHPKTVDFRRKLRRVAFFLWGKMAKGEKKNVKRRRKILQKY